MKKVGKKQRRASIPEAGVANAADGRARHAFGRRRGNPPGQHIRLAIACIVLAACIAVPAAASQLQSSATSVAMAVDAVSDNPAVAVDAASGTSRSNFEAELFSLEGLSELRTTEDCGVVGFVCEGSGADAFRRLSERLQERGWTAVESGSDVAGSFVKGDGALRWAFASCSGMGERTCVVVNVA